jgi:hypothetical protein
MMRNRSIRSMYLSLLLLVCLAVLLGGCMGQARHQQGPPLEQQVAEIQESVDRFQEANGVLPIHTRDADTSVFHRYVIDLHKLVPQYLTEPPQGSFEMGGYYQYVLFDVEEDPSVKLVDVRISRVVSELQNRVNLLLREGEYLPIDEMVGDGYFSLDYEQMNMREAPTVNSPFSGQPLSLIVNQQGEVGVDYRSDLYQVLEKMDAAQIENMEPGEDIRQLLVKDSHFVPAHSFPYTLENEQPVLIESWNKQN